MKKTFYNLLLAGMLMVGISAYGQVSQSHFIPSNSNSLSVSEQNGINVSYQQGSIGSNPAICLEFKNTSNKAIAFGWILKDAKGNVVHTGENLTLAAGQSLDLTKNPVLKNRLTFILNNGMKAEDYKTEITLKN
jgi:hypothetical protein